MAPRGTCAPEPRQASARATSSRHTSMTAWTGASSSRAPRANHSLLARSQMSTVAVLDPARVEPATTPAGRMRERSGLLKEAWYAAARSPELTADAAARPRHPRAAARALAIRRPPRGDGRSLRPSQRGAVEGCGLRRQARVPVSRLGLRPRGTLRRGALERAGRRAAAVRRAALPRRRAPRARLGVDGRHAPRRASRSRCPTGTRPAGEPTTWSRSFRTR